MLSKHETYSLMSPAADVHMVQEMLQVIHLLHKFVKFDKYGTAYPEGSLAPESTGQWAFDQRC